jgi:hypothetical protein
MPSGKLKRAALVAVPVTAALSLTFASATTINVGGAASTPRISVGARPNAVSGTYVSGGATLPAIAYDGGSAGSVAGNTNLSTNTTAVAGTVFKYWGKAFSYCQTGSGFGKKILDGTVAADASACVAPPGTAAGFTTLKQTFADVVGSDSPIAASEYSAFLTDAKTGGQNIVGRVAPVQVPYVAGSIALFYRNSSIGSATVTLAPSTICGIASGAITNWDEIPVNPAEPTGAKYGAKTLTFVVRADSSGTTFSFSNYLSGGSPKTCSATFGLNSVFDIDDTTVSPAPATQALPYPSGTKDYTFLAGNGNGTVVSVILGTVAGNCATGSAGKAGAICKAGETTAIAPDGAIGYVEAANAKAAVKPASGINFAKVGTTISGAKDPIADLPETANAINSTFLSSGYVVAASINNGRPSPDIETLAAAGITAPDFPGTKTSTGPCLAIVDPAKYEVSVKGYPIVAVSNLEFSAVGNGTTGSADLQKLAGFLSNNANVGAGKITSVDPSTATTGKTGYAALGNIDGKGITTAIGCIHA